MKHTSPISVLALCLAMAATQAAYADDSSSSSNVSSSSEMSSSSSSSSSSAMSSSEESSSSSSSALSSSSSKADDDDSSSSSSVDVHGNGHVQLNWGSLISALQSNTVFDFTMINSTTTVNIVMVSSLTAEGNTNALDNALKKHQTDITTLQASVEANAVLSAKLEAANLDASDVIAVVLETDGSVTVYVDDRA